jgi:hypothetical protein
LWFKANHRRENLSRKKLLVEWLRVKALSSNPSTAKRKNPTKQKAKDAGCSCL